MFVDISLPPPVVVSPFPLILLYGALASLDFVLMKHHPVLTHRQWRWVMAIYHVMIPLIIVSPYKPLDVLFAAAPWFMAAYTAYLNMETLTVVSWVQALASIPLDDNRLTPSECRREGLFKVARGLLKIGFMKIVINSLLPVDPTHLLHRAFLDPVSLWQTLLFGIKAYCMLGAVDAFMGLEQAILGLRFLDLFNAPILAYSPRDFWSNRWNRIVRNLLHRIVFTNNRHGDTLMSSFAARGLLVFVISGVFHELIIMSTCRKITLENLVFFTLQGVAVGVEVVVRKTNSAWKQEPTGWTRLVCILLHLSFLSITGRLFLAPFIRSDFLEVRKR